MEKTCCQKIAVLREWIKIASKCHANFASFLSEAKDSGEFDQFTLNVLDENLEQLEYDLDSKVAFNLVCECK